MGGRGVLNTVQYSRSTFALQSFFYSILKYVTDNTFLEQIQQSGNCRYRYKNSLSNDKDRSRRFSSWAAWSILSARAELTKWGVAVNQISEMIPNILVRHCCLFFSTSDLSSEITAEFTAQRPVPK